MDRTCRRIAAGLIVCVGAACGPTFQLTRYPVPQDLYVASLRQFERHKWSDAIAGFDRLTSSLTTRDTLLPRSYWFLARAHQEIGEHVLSAQAFGRLFQSFPEDSLAPTSAIQSAREYRRLWPKSDRDPTYGYTASDAYASVLQFFPNSPQADTARKELAELDDRFAQRDYNIGLYYFRDRAYDSALIFFNDVIRKYPATPTARQAGVRIIEAYRAIQYGADAADACVAMLERFPDDAEVKRTCPSPATGAGRDTTTAAATGPETAAR